MWVLDEERDPLLGSPSHLAGFGQGASELASTQLFFPFCTLKMRRVWTFCPVTLILQIKAPHDVISQGRSFHGDFTLPEMSRPCMLERHRGPGRR